VCACSSQSECRFRSGMLRQYSTLHQWRMHVARRGHDVAAPAATSRRWVFPSSEHAVQTHLLGAATCASSYETGAAPCSCAGTSSSLLLWLLDVDLQKRVAGTEKGNRDESERYRGKRVEPRSVFARLCMNDLLPIRHPYEQRGVPPSPRPPSAALRRLLLAQPASFLIVVATCISDSPAGLAVAGSTPAGLRMLAVAVAAGSSPM